MGLLTLNPVCELLGLLPKSGENFMSVTPLEMCSLRKMLTCSILTFVVPVLSYEFVFVFVVCLHDSLLFRCVDVFMDQN